MMSKALLLADAGDGGDGGVRFEQSVTGLSMLSARSSFKLLHNPSLTMIDVWPTTRTPLSEAERSAVPVRPAFANRKTNHLEGWSAAAASE